MPAEIPVGPGYQVPLATEIKTDRRGARGRGRHDRHRLAGRADRRHRTRGRGADGPRSAA
ncbi:hypothetical protein QJS66_03740 [Kocuria rhizophila]|nr:hypothetical protein QJS66_03740 [Kocuria rhizophila]